MRGNMPGRLALGVLVVLLLAACQPLGLKLDIKKAATLDPKWELQQKIPAYVSSSGDSFGCAVAVSESAAADYVIVGNEMYTGWTGSAYVYRRDRSAGSDPWKYQKTLSILAPVPLASSSYGYSVDVNGSQAVVGADFDTGNQGAIFIYEYEAGDWAQKGKFPGASAVDRLGYSVAITADTVVAGAPFNTLAGTGAGRVDIFTKSGGTWSSGGSVFANDAKASSSFGKAVDIDGNLMIVGSPDFDVTTSGNQGKVYIFQKSASWSVQAIAQPSLSISNGYGQTVSIRGSDAFAGTPTTPAFVEVYSNPSGSWTNAAVTAKGSGFGTSVAVGSEYAVVGAPQESGNSGLAYIYRKTGSVWSPYGPPLPLSSVPANSFFGCAVAISDNYCVIGAKGNGAPGSGAVYIYTLIK